MISYFISTTSSADIDDDVVVEVGSRRHRVHDISLTVLRLHLRPRRPSYYMNPSLVAMWECPKKGTMGDDGSVTLQKRPINIIILPFWRSHAEC